FSPLNVPIRSDSGPTRASYTLYNPGAQAVVVTPFVQCPTASIRVFLIETPLEIPPGQLRQIQVGYEAIEAAVSVGQLIGCLLLAGNTTTPIFLQIVPPPPGGQLGALDVLALLVPEGVQTESVQFELDLVTNLKLSLTLSGMAIRADLAWGVTGPEFAVLDATAFLGLFEVQSQVVFAAAFDAQNQVIVVPDKPLSFVKKRFRTRFQLFGLLVDNLAIFENVKFTYPFAGEAQGLSAVQNPDYRFGDILSLAGQTVLGVPVKLTFGLCADPAVPNVIKRRTFAGSVVCSDYIPGIFPPVPVPLLFTVAQLALGPFLLDPIQMGGNLEFRPNDALRGALSLRTNLFDLIALSTTVSLSGTEVESGVTVAVLSQPEQSVILQFDKALQLTSALVRINVPLAEHRLSLAARTASGGTRSLLGTLTLAAGPGRLLASALWAGTEALQFQNATIAWSHPLEWGTLNLSVGVNQAGMQQAKADLQIAF
ncbi:MAG TPA: hypothetical protein VIL47_02790, partial [Candidatus Bipolaricaulota bacterium]